RIVPISAVSIYIQTVYGAFFEGFYIAIYKQAIARPFIQYAFSNLSGVRLNVTHSQFSSVAFTVSKENLNQHFSHINRLLVYFAIFECFNAIFRHFYVYGVSVISVMVVITSPLICLYVGMDTNFHCAIGIVNFFRVFRRLFLVYLYRFYVMLSENTFVITNVKIFATLLASVEHKHRIDKSVSSIAIYCVDIETSVLSPLSPSR